MLNVQAGEPVLEAVTIDRGQQKVSVATLGQPDLEKLHARVARELESSLSVPKSHCGLVDGNRSCDTCETPLSATQRKAPAIRTEGNATTIARVTCPTAPKFWRWRDLPFPKIVQRDVEFLEHVADHDHADEWKLQLLLAFACGTLGLLAAFVFPAARIPLFVLSYLAGAWFPAEEVWERIQKRTLDVHFLMLAGAVGSACIGAWGEGATLLFLFSFSGALEHYALGRTQKEIRALFRDAPKTATVLDASGNETEVAVDSLRTGTRLLIKPGSQFPVDAEIIKGATAADESNLTGEATPVEKKTGDSALAGTINLWGAVEVVVTRPAAESALQKIIALIKEAQHQKAPAQLLHLWHPGTLRGDVFRVVARVWTDRVHFQHPGAKCVLSYHDPAGGGFALRAGAVHSFSGAGGDCLWGAARDFVSRRGGSGKACGGKHRLFRQDWNADHRRTPGGND